MGAGCGAVCVPGRSSRHDPPCLLGHDPGMPWLQAAVLVCMQARTLRDPVLLADPLFAVSGAALRFLLLIQVLLCAQHVPVSNTSHV